jgi:hypothetical protein
MHNRFRTVPAAGQVGGAEIIQAMRDNGLHGAVGNCELVRLQEGLWSKMRYIQFRDNSAHTAAGAQPSEGGRLRLDLPQQPKLLHRARQTEDLLPLRRVLLHLPHQGTIQIRTI